MQKSDKHFRYAPNEWIVHINYGIGQVAAIENKFIGNNETTYYRIETNNSIIWVPVEGNDDLLRPVTPPEEFRQAMAVLRRPSRQMSSAYQSRLARIRKAKDKGTPQALARIIRDLWARQKRKGKLSNTEGQALRNLIDRLMAEWSVSMDMDEDQTSERLYTLLQQHALPASGA